MVSRPTSNLCWILERSQISVESHYRSYCEGHRPGKVDGKVGKGQKGGKVGTRKRNSDDRRGVMGEGHRGVSLVGCIRFIG